MLRLFKHLTAKVVAVSFIVSLLIVLQPAARTEAQIGGKQLGAGPCAIPYVWAVDSNGDAQEINILDGSVTGRSVNVGNTAKDIAVSADNAHIYSITESGEVAVYSIETGAKTRTVTVDYAAAIAGGTREFTSLAIDYDGNLITVAKYSAGFMADDRVVWNVMDKQELADDNANAVTASKLTQPLSDIDPAVNDATFVGGLAVLPEGLLSLVSSDAQPDEAVFVLFPRIGDDDYGTPHPVGTPKFNGNSIDNIRGMIYSSGVVFLLTEDGGLYYTDDIQYSIIGENNEGLDPTYAIEMTRYQHPIVGAADFVGIAAASEAGCVNNRVALTSAVIGSFAQDTDGVTGNLVPGKFTVRFSVELENVTSEDVDGYSVYFKPVFNVDSFRIDEVSLLGGSVVDPIASGTEINLSDVSQDDMSLESGGIVAFDVTVRYTQLTDSPVCDLLSCISNTVLLPGKTLSRSGRGVVDIPVVPGVRVVKTGGDAGVVGESVSYAYVVTNTGSEPVAHVGVEETGLTPKAVVWDTPDLGDVNGDGLLDVDEIWVFNVSRTVAQDATVAFGAYGAGAETNGIVGHQGTWDLKATPQDVDPVLPVDPADQGDANPVDPGAHPDPGQAGQGVNPGNQGAQLDPTGQQGQADLEDTADVPGDGVVPVPIVPVDGVDAGQVDAGQAADVKPAGAGVGLAETGAVAPAGGLLGVGVVVLLGAGILLTVAGRRHGRAV